MLTGSEIIGCRPPCFCEILPGTRSAFLAARWIASEWPSIPIVSWLREPLPAGAVCEFPVVVGLVLASGHLAACGALLLDDMVDRPTLNPWVGCLYVAPDARGRGLGRTLFRELCERARSRGIRRLFLFCRPELSTFYGSEGWSPIETRVYEGELCIVMERSFEEELPLRVPL